MIGLAWSIDMLWPLIIVIPFWRLVIRPAFVSMYWECLFSFFHFLFLALLCGGWGVFDQIGLFVPFLGFPFPYSFLISIRYQFHF